MREKWRRESENVEIESAWKIRASECRGKSGQRIGVRVRAWCFLIWGEIS